jgi:hypothetical protein
LSDELGKALGELGELATAVRESRKRKVWQDAQRQLTTITAKVDELTQHPPRLCDVANWAEGLKLVQDHAYGLTPGDRAAIADQLLTSKQPGLQLAGIDLLLSGIENDLKPKGQPLMDALSRAMGEPVDEPEPCVVSALASVNTLRERLWRARQVEMPLPVAERWGEAFAAIKAQIRIAATRELDKRRKDELRQAADTYISIVDEKDSDFVEVHCELDRAVAEVVEAAEELVRARRASSLQSEIALFVFGMGVEVAERARLEGDPQWDLPTLLSSVTSSLRQHGFGEAELRFRRTTFLDLVVAGENRSNQDDPSWIRAGVLSMDRFCRGGEMKAGADFTRHAELFKSEQVQRD